MRISRYNSVMARVVTIHPSHPQARIVAKVVATLRNRGLIAYPTDSIFALGCHLGDKEAVDRIRETVLKINAVSTTRLS